MPNILVLISKLAIHIAELADSDTIYMKRYNEYSVTYRAPLVVRLRQRDRMETQHARLTIFNPVIISTTNHISVVVLCHRMILLVDMDHHSMNFSVVDRTIERAVSVLTANDVHTRRNVDFITRSSPI